MYLMFMTNIEHTGQNEGQGNGENLQEGDLRGEVEGQYMGSVLVSSDACVQADAGLLGWQYSQLTFYS